MTVGAKGQDGTERNHECQEAPISEHTSLVAERIKWPIPVFLESSDNEEIYGNHAGSEGETGPHLGDREGTVHGYSARSLTKGDPVPCVSTFQNLPQRNSSLGTRTGRPWWPWDKGDSHRSRKIPCSSGDRHREKTIREI